MKSFLLIPLLIGQVFGWYGPCAHPDYGCCPGFNAPFFGPGPIYDCPHMGFFVGGPWTGKNAPINKDIKTVEKSEKKETPRTPNDSNFSGSRNNMVPLNALWSPNVPPFSLSHTPGGFFDSGPFLTPYWQAGFFPPTQQMYAQNPNFMANSQTGIPNQNVNKQGTANQNQNGFGNPSSNNGVRFDPISSNRAGFGPPFKNVGFSPVQYSAAGFGPVFNNGEGFGPISNCGLWPVSAGFFGPFNYADHYPNPNPDPFFFNDRSDQTRVANTQPSPQTANQIPKQPSDRSENKDQGTDQNQNTSQPEGDKSVSNQSQGTYQPPVQSALYIQPNYQFHVPGETYPSENINYFGPAHLPNPLIYNHPHNFNYAQNIVPVEHRQQEKQNAVHPQENYQEQKIQQKQQQQQHETQKQQPEQQQGQQQRQSTPKNGPQMVFRIGNPSIRLP